MLQIKKLKGIFLKKDWNAIRILDRGTDWRATEDQWKIVWTLF